MKINNFRMSESSLYLLLVDGITSTEQLILLLSSSASSIWFIIFVACLWDSSCGIWSLTDEQRLRDVGGIEWVRSVISVL